MSEREIKRLSVWSYQTGSRVESTPAVTDTKVIAGSWGGRIYCLDEDSGSLIWSCQAGRVVWSSPAVADGRVFIGSDDGKIHCSRCI